MPKFITLPRLTTDFSNDECQVYGLKLNLNAIASYRWFPQPKEGSLYVCTSDGSARLLEHLLEFTLMDGTVYYAWEDETLDILAELGGLL